MQLFNGLNMGMIKFYRLDFETPETGNGNPKEVDYSEKLNTINQKINELKNEDQNTENDAAAKETLNKLINTEFLSGFINSLNENQKNSLKSTVKSLLDVHKNEENFKTEYKGLIDLATALGINLEGGTETSEQPTEPKLELSGTLNGIEGPKKKEDGSYEEGEKKLYSQLTREAPQEGQDIPDDKNFYKTAKDVKTQLEDVKGLLKNEKLKDNESLKGLEDKLGVIQTVIDNTTPDNVRILQKFISENLDEGSKEKKDFDNASKKGENFDGKFGLGTLAGLNKVLEKTGKYIDSFKDQPSEGAEDEPFKNIKVKESINLPEGDTQIDATNLLESLPNGAKAEFKDNAGIDKSKTDEQEVTVVVKSGDKTEEITIIATVDTTNKKVGLKIKENGNPTAPTATETTSTTETPITPTKPLEITKNGQAEEHPVVTGDIARRINTPLYYVNTGNEAASEQNNKVDENGDREYLMQVNNETYKVKLDQNGNLKPLAINYESNTKVLLKNNPSCIAYLQSKMPPNLPGSPRIARNPNMEDYVIRSTTDRGVKGLTIEPMTLDGKWLVGSNLGNNLALLNFTNFLRGNENIDNLRFKNDNPDLKLDNGKLYVRIKKGTRLADNSKSGKWYEVNLSKFGISQNALEDFIKYNNSEDWNDNWDKKKDNKGYTKIDFPNISGPAAPAATGTPADSPTGTPADSPTGTPADSPTGTPADSPTGTPAGTPADSPTGTPAGTPADSPADSPTGTPADSPADSPTGTPADSPTGTPADSPTGTPADSPTGTPADSPAETPAGTPADSPTESDKKEILNELWKMDDNDFNAMKISLSDNMFIEKSENNKITYNLQKVKNYLEGLKDDKWSTFRNKLGGKPEGRAWISAIQILLNEKYSNDNDKLEIDGKLGPKTKEKVIKFQKEKSIPDDGLPGGDTIKKLLGDFSGETPAGTPADSPAGTPAGTPADSPTGTPADSPRETTPNPEQTTQNPQNLGDTSWMEHAQQTGHLPTGPDNTARTPTENSDIANNSRGYYADNLLNGTQDV